MSTIIGKIYTSSKEIPKQSSSFWYKSSSFSEELMSSFFEEELPSSWLWSNFKTSFKFLVRCSLKLDPSRKASSWDFWLRHKEVSRLAAFKNFGWALNQILTWSGSAFEALNWFCHLTNACRYKDGNCLLFFNLLYLYCHENIQDKAKLEKYFKSMGIRDSWELNILLNWANPCWTCSGYISGIGPKCWIKWPQNN